MSNIVTQRIIFRFVLLIVMQTPKNKRIFIPVFLVLIVIVAIAISPISTAIAQESSDGESSDHSSDDKSYDDGKDDKSCADKKKDRSESTETSGEQA